MIFKTLTPQEKRKVLRKDLDSGKLLRFPGAFSPLVSRVIEETGFDGVYISGAVLSADLGLPDIGLTSFSEVIQRGRQISRVTRLPSLIDIDTGFGSVMNVVRTVRELDDLGLAGCHLEDQINPKRCGHLDGKELIDIKPMTHKIRGATDAKSDDNFLIIARTDARSVEGLNKAIDRAKAYVDAGAEMIFPEALQNEKEFEVFRKSIDVPLLCNMTEFGKSPLLNTKELENLGYNIVIYPVTSLRLAMGATEEGLKEIFLKGDQKNLLGKMQDRKRLYEVLQYEKYNELDKNIYNFEL